MKLIDKDALVAEIERLTDVICQGMITNESKLGIEYFKERVLSFLDTLEVKEVDLEEELNNYGYHYDYVSLANRKELIDFAKHFFELGLNARIDKELVEEVYSHLNSIKDTADRMTSGNFMHHRAAIKFSANTIAKVLELIGIKEQKGEKV